MVKACSVIASCVPGLLGNEIQLGRELDAGPQGPRDRTKIDMEAHHPLDDISFRRFCSQPVSHMDPPDEDDAVIGLLDIASNLGDQAPVTGGDIARLQRASQGPCQSAPGCRDHIVQSGGVRFVGFRSHPVMVRHLVMHTEPYLAVDRQCRLPNTPAETLDPDL